MTRLRRDRPVFLGEAHPVDDSELQSNMLPPPRCDWCGDYIEEDYPRHRPPLMHARCQRMAEELGEHDDD